MAGVIAVTGVTGVLGRRVAERRHVRVADHEDATVLVLRGGARTEEEKSEHRERQGTHGAGRLRAAYP